MKNTVYHDQREIHRGVSYADDGLPKRYVFVLTNKCNLSCSFCFQDRKGLPNSMSAEDWIEVSDKFESGSHITLTGGEPLTFKGFETVLRHITKRHTVNIICNGVLLSRRIIDLLIEVGNVQILSISVDTIGNYNRAVREKDYDKMIDSLNYLVEKRKETNSSILIDTKSVVTDVDSYSLFDIYKHCIETLNSDTHSFQFFKGSPVQHADKMFPYEEIFTEPDPYRYTTINTMASEFDKVREYCDKNSTVCYSHPKFIDFGDQEQDYLELLSSKMNKLTFDAGDYEPCKAPWESTHINADGATFACLAIDFGDIRKFKSVKEMYNQKIVKEFRSTIRKCGTVPACHRCGYLKLAG